MAYTPNTPWVDGEGGSTPTSAARLNNMEAGIVKARGCFSAYRSTAQSSSASAFAKVQFNTEEWDTDNWYDNVTNHRFVPQVAGYYQLTGSVGITSSFADAERFFVELYKNGSLYRSLTQLNVASATDIWVKGGAALAVANGTTDYFEVFVYTTAAETIATLASSTFFQGFLIGTT